MVVLVIENVVVFFLFFFYCVYVAFFGCGLFFTAMAVVVFVTLIVAVVFHRGGLQN